MDANTLDDGRLETLKRLLYLSESADGCARLTSDGAIASVLRRLSSSPSHLLLLRLRLISNLCLEHPANQESFLASGGPDRVASVLLSGSHVTAEIFLAVLRILENVATGGEAYKAAVWARFFPNWFREMARIEDAAVCNNLCLVLETCCSDAGCRTRLGELCEVGRGLPILTNIIFTISRVSQKEYFFWLIGRACIEEIYFTLVFHSLSSGSTTESSISIDYTKEQAFLLESLSHCLSVWYGYFNTISNEFTISVLKILKEVSFVICDTSLKKCNMPIGSLAIKVLECSLAILRDICYWKHQCLQSIEDPANSLVPADFIKLLLAFLQELESPNLIKEQRMQNSTYSEVCPYQGFRKDVVSVISCYLHGRKNAQDEIRNQKGIPLLLQQCVLGDYFPDMSKWTTLSIRHLLEGNLENQYEVAELEQKEPVITSQIAQMGLIVEIDEETQRLKMLVLDIPATVTHANYPGTGVRVRRKCVRDTGAYSCAQDICSLSPVEELPNEQVFSDVHGQEFLFTP